MDGMDGDEIWVDVYAPPDYDDEDLLPPVLYEEDLAPAVRPPAVDAIGNRLFADLPGSWGILHLPTDIYIWQGDITVHINAKQIECYCFPATQERLFALDHYYQVVEWVHVRTGVKAKLM